MIQFYSLQGEINGKVVPFFIYPKKLIPFYNIIKSYLDEIKAIEPSIPRMPKSKIKKSPSKSINSRETDCPCGFKIETDEKCGTNKDKQLLRVILHKKICAICNPIEETRHRVVTTRIGL